MEPAVTSSKPAIMRSVEVLPHPDGPSIEKNSPRSMSSDRSSTAVTSWKRLVTRSSRTSVCANQHLVVAHSDGWGSPEWVECNHAETCGNTRLTRHRRTNTRPARLGLGYRGELRLVID